MMSRLRSSDGTMDELIVNLLPAIAFLCLWVPAVWALRGWLSHHDSRTTKDGGGMSQHG